MAESGDKERLSRVELREEVLVALCISKKENSPAVRGSVNHDVFSVSTKKGRMKEELPDVS